MLPFVSFLIPVRDDEARLRRCLASIRRNGYPEDRYEIVVVDNGSTDRSVEVAKVMGARVILAPGLRVTALRNRAAAAARGEVLAFVDADHEIPEGWAEHMIRTLQLPGVGATGSTYRAPPDGTWVQRMYDAFRPRLAGCCDAEWLPGGNLALWRRAFESCGGFDVTLETCEDVDFCRRLRRDGMRVVSNERLRSVHLGDPATLHGLFVGELWRGRHNLRASLRSPVTARGLLSLVVPLLDLGLILAGALGLLGAPLGGWLVTVGAFSMILAISALRVGRMMVNLGTATPQDFGQALTVAAVYDLARALAPISRATHAIRRASA